MPSSDNSINQSISTPVGKNKFAFVVGVNNSSDSPPYRTDLKHAEKDAEDMAYLLKQPECGFALLLPAVIGEKATSPTIKQGVMTLVRKRTEQDFLLFYFAGHAVPINNNIYFVTYDFQEDSIEVDPDFYFSMRWLWKVLFKSVGAGKVLIILDCCYAGNMVETEDDPLKIDLSRLLEVWDTGSSGKDQKNCLRLILTATGYNIQAQEQNGHGIMTGLVLLALRGEEEDSLDKDGNVEIKALHAYLQKKMPKEQLPDLAGKFGPYNCILASYPNRSVDLRHRAKENELKIEISKLMNKVSEVSSIITDPSFFKELAEASTVLHVQQFDLSTCQTASIADLNQEKVSAFFKRDRVQRQDDFYRDIPDNDLLQQFGFLHEAHPTYGALLCFGQSPTRSVAGAFTRCTLWNGDDRHHGWLEAQDYRRDLITQFELSIDFLRKNLHLPRVISNNEGIEEPEIPIVALREALANALVHREYTNQTSPVYVDVFNDRIEIISPGPPPEPMTLELLEEDHISHPRNPQIARLFYLYGYVEKVGSGIQRMQHAMEKAGLPLVKFELGKDKSFKVIFYRPLLTSAKAIDLQRRIEILLRENVAIDYTQLFGVDILIKKMKNLLMNPRGSWIISLFGEGGIGKTALAYESVSRFSVEAGFTKVAWVSANTLQILPNGTLMRSSSAELRWIDLIKKIAEQLGVQMGYSSTMWLSDFQKGIRSLPANDKCLIVVDNLETIEDLTETIYYLCGSTPSNQIINPHKVLITTRCSILDGAQHITEIQLRGLEREVALKFIRELGNEDIKQASDEELMPIVSVTEGNPLLIKLSITRLLTSHLPLTIVLKELQEVNKQIGKNIIDYLHTKSLSTLKQKCGEDAALKILSAFCPLGTGGVVDYFDLFKYSGIADEEIFRKTLQTACDLSLIHARPPSSYSIHSLLWNFVCGIDG